MKKFLFLFFILLGGCSVDHTSPGTQDDPVQARPVIVESTDGSRYKCQAATLLSRAGKVSTVLIDCEKE